MNTDLILLAILIVLSGTFSGAEIALTSLSPAKVRTLKDNPRFGSKIVYKLKQSPEELLITILIGNNIVNILAPVIATIWATKIFGADQTALVVTTVLLTIVILIFGEIAPKTYAQKHAEGFARLMAYPLYWLSYILWPVVKLLEKFIHSLMHVMKAKSPIKSMSEEEILAMVDIGTKEGVIEEHEQELIENVLEFTETTAEEVMTIKSKIESLNINSSVKDAAHFFTTHSHSRIPVFKGNIDNVVGILTVHDILKITHQENPPIKILKDFDYTAPIVVPKTKSISKLFREFQKRRQHIAIVVDEGGHTVGLVTLEDILEEQEVNKVQSMGRNEWLIDASATIEEINESTGLTIEYPVHQSLSLLILEELQGFPNLGQKIEYGNVELQIKKMSKKKIEEVLISKL